MARIRINTEEVADGGGFVEPGKYRAKLVECEEADSSKGNPMLVWQWEIVEGEFEGSTIKSWTSLQDHALFGLKEHLEAFGLTGDLDFDSDKLIGKHVMLTVGKRKVKDRDTGEDKEMPSVVKLSPVAAKGAAGAGAKAGAKGAAKGKGKNIPF